ncbi:MAG: MerC domain-containing protein, partial [Gemmatimonadaceae bacterium]|nr:MerC domain-containing protein [Gemmatimonadaceae bacterium]
MESPVRSSHQEPLGGAPFGADRDRPGICSSLDICPTQGGSSSDGRAIPVDRAPLPLISMLIQYHKYMCSPALPDHSPATPWLDRLGMATSTLCAVHCAATALFMGVLSAVGARARSPP